MSTLIQIPTNKYIEIIDLIAIRVENFGCYYYTGITSLWYWFPGWPEKKVDMDIHNIRLGRVTYNGIYCGYMQSVLLPVINTPRDEYH